MTDKHNKWLDEFGERVNKLPPNHENNYKHIIELMEYRRSMDYNEGHKFMVAMVKNNNTDEILTRFGLYLMVDPTNTSSEVNFWRKKIIEHRKKYQNELP